MRREKDVTDSGDSCRIQKWRQQIGNKAEEPERRTRNYSKMSILLAVVSSTLDFQSSKRHIRALPAVEFDMDTNSIKFSSNKGLNIDFNGLDDACLEQVFECATHLLYSTDSAVVPSNPSKILIPTMMVLVNNLERDKTLVQLRYPLAQLLCSFLVQNRKSNNETVEQISDPDSLRSICWPRILKSEWSLGSTSNSSRVPDNSALSRCLGHRWSSLIVKTLTSCPRDVHESLPVRASPVEEFIPKSLEEFSASEFDSIVCEPLFAILQQVNEQLNGTLNYNEKAKALLFSYWHDRTLNPTAQLTFPSSLSQDDAFLGVPESPCIGISCQETELPKMDHRKRKLKSSRGQVKRS